MLAITVIESQVLRETYKVVAEELHNKRGVLVALLAQGIKLCTIRVSG